MLHKAILVERANAISDTEPCYQKSSHIEIVSIASIPNSRKNLAACQQDVFALLVRSIGYQDMMVWKLNVTEVIVLCYCLSLCQFVHAVTVIELIVFSYNEVIVQ